MPETPNPWEDLVEELSAAFVDLVYELVDEFAPNRPWWEKTLTTDQQLWRWIYGPSNTPQDGTRMKVIPWLIEAAVYMGANTAEEAMAMIEDTFTSPSAEDLVPLAVQAQIPVELLEIVQAVGPHDAALHIQKMERLVKERQSIVADLASTSTPEIPNVPPPLPIEAAPGTAGSPLYGEAPINAPPVFSA